MFSKKAFSEMLWKPFYLYAGCFLIVVIASSALHYFLNDRWPIKVTLILIIPFVFTILLTAYRAQYQLGKIETVERYEAEENSKVLISNYFDTLITEIKSGGNLVKKDAKRLLRVVLPALNQGMSLEDVNAMFLEENSKGSYVTIKSVLDYFPKELKLQNSTWIYPKSAKLEIYLGEKLLNELVLFETKVQTEV